MIFNTYQIVRLYGTSWAVPRQKLPIDNNVNKPCLLNMSRREMLELFRIPPQSHTSLKKQKPSIKLLLLVLRNVTDLMNGLFLYETVQMGVLRLKALILTNHIVQWHMLTH